MTIRELLIKIGLKPQGCSCLYFEQMFKKMSSGISFKDAINEVAGGCDLRISAYNCMTAAIRAVYKKGDLYALNDIIGKQAINHFRKPSTKWFLNVLVENSETIEAAKGLTGIPFILTMCGISDDKKSHKYICDIVERLPKEATVKDAIERIAKEQGLNDREMKARLKYDVSSAYRSGTLYFLNDFTGKKLVSPQRQPTYAELCHALKKYLDF